MMTAIVLMFAACSPPPPGSGDSGSSRPPHAARALATTSEAWGRAFGEATVVWPATADRSTTVVRHAPDGHWVDRWELGPGEELTFEVGAGADLTLVTEGVPFTILGVRPGDRIDLNDPIGLPDRGFTGVERPLVVPALDDVGEVHVTTFCADGLGQSNGWRTRARDLPEAMLSVDRHCAEPGDRIDVVAWALAGNREIIAMTSGTDVPITATGVELPAWGAPDPAVQVEVPASTGDSGFVQLRSWPERGGRPGVGYTTNLAVTPGAPRVALPIAPTGFAEGAGVCVSFGWVDDRQACTVVRPVSEQVQLTDTGPEATFELTKEGLSLAVTPEREGTMHVTVHYRSATDIDSPFVWRVIGPARDGFVRSPDLPEDLRPAWLEQEPYSYEAVYFRNDAVPTYEAWRTGWAMVVPSSGFMAPGMMSAAGAIEARWYE